MEKYGRARQATDDSTAHSLCMLNTKPYRHTLRICNTYHSSTATVVMRIRLNVTLIRTLPVLFVYILWAFRQLSMFHLKWGHWAFPSTSFAFYCSLNIQLFAAACYAYWQTHLSNINGCNNYSDLFQQSLSALGYYFMLSESMAIELKFIFTLLLGSLYFIN